MRENDIGGKVNSGIKHRIYYVIVNYRSTPFQVTPDQGCLIYIITCFSNILLEPKCHIKMVCNSLIFNLRLNWFNFTRGRISAVICCHTLPHRRRCSGVSPCDITPQFHCDICSPQRMLRSRSYEDCCSSQLTVTDSSLLMEIPEI